MRGARWLAVLWALTVSAGRAAGQAEEEAEVVPEALSLQEVLASVELHHPTVLAELAEVRAARGAARAARGAYDPSLRVEAGARPSGYYDYRALDVRVSQLTPWLGAGLYAGYRLQRGRLPAYFGELETLDQGELRAGLRVPLWKDRQIDDARAGRARTRAATRGAEAELVEAKLRLWLEASAAYYQWVAAHEGRRVHVELLALARRRVEQIAGKVRAGALPPFAGLDNERALLSRQAKLVQATRKLEQARLKLSMYWRDAAGRPQLAEGRRPPPLRLPTVSGALGDARAQSLAVSRHPTVARYAAKAREVAVKLRLADNRVAPKLDLKGEVSRDLGSGSDDARKTLGPTVLKAGAVFELPLALRSARGKRDRARAQLASIRARAQLARDKVRMRVQDAASALRRAVERAGQARRAAEVAERLAAGERRRFEMGATTLVWVTIREKTAADARLDAIQAVVEAQLAQAAYEVALAERPGRAGAVARPR